MAMLTALVADIDGRRRARPYLAPLAVLLGCAVAFVYVTISDPNQPGHYPTCPWLLLTHMYCPGCGFLRMVHALGHGQIGHAFGLNPFAFAMLPVMAYAWGRWLVRSVRRRPRESVLHPVFIWGFLVLVIAFWIVRNLPFGAALAP